MSQVYLLNQYGIEHLNSGRIEDAKSAFAEALLQEQQFQLYENMIININKGTKGNSQIKPLVSNLTSAEDWHVLQRTVLNIYQQNEYDEGMHVYTETLEIRDSQLCSESQCSIVCYNLGQLFARSKQYEEARNWFEQSLAFFNQCRQERTPIGAMDIVKILHNLGHCHYRLGDFKPSMQYYQEAMCQVQKLNLGQEHLAVSANCVAVILFHESPSNVERALELLLLSLSVNHRIFSHCTKQIGTILNNIGHVYFMCSEYDRALQIFSESLDIRRTVLGSDSVDVAATLLNIGICYHQRGDTPKAMNCYKDYIGSFVEDVDFSNNASIVASYKKLAILCREHSDFETAIQFFQQSLQAEQAVLETSHPGLASTLNEMGTISYDKEEHGAALNYFNEALKVTKSSVKPNYAQVISILSNIAKVHQCRGCMKSALETYEEVFKLQLEAYGCRSLEVASTLSYMGLLYYNAKESSTSLECFSEALIVYRLHFGSDDHWEIALTLSNVGQVLFERRNYSLAGENFMASIEIHNKLGSRESHIAISNLLSKMATIGLKIGDYDRAVHLDKESIRLAEKNLGENDVEVAFGYKHLGWMYEEQGRIENALECLNKAHCIFIFHHKRSNDTTTDTATYLPEISQIRYLIGSLHFRQGDIGEMMNSFEEVVRITPHHEAEQYCQYFAKSVQINYEVRCSPHCSGAA